MQKETNIYYVYQLRDPRVNTPFYIGKGKGNRAWDHLKYKNRDHKTHTIKNIINDGFPIQVEVLYHNLPENVAFAIEMLLIKKYGRRCNNTGCLTNLTIGGEGPSGYKPSAQQKLKHKIAINRPEHIANLSNKAKLRCSDPKYLTAMSERQKLAMSKPEVKARHKAAVKTAMNTPETKARVSASSKGRIVKPSTIELNRIRALGVNNPMYGKTGNKSPITGRKNVHNPYTLELKLVSKDEADHYLTDGWVLGRPPKQ